MPKEWSHRNDPVVERIAINANKGPNGSQRYVTVKQCLERLEAEYWFGREMINWSTEDGLPSHLVTSTWDI